MHNLETSHKNKLLYLCYINKSSLNKNFDDLQHLLSCADKKFYMTAISKTKITKQVFLSNNLNTLFNLHQMRLLQAVPFHRHIQRDLEAGIPGCTPKLGAKKAFYFSIFYVAYIVKSY